MDYKPVSLAKLLRSAKKGETFITFAHLKDVQGRVSRMPGLKIEQHGIDFLLAGKLEGQSFQRALLVTVLEVPEPPKSKGRPKRSKAEKQKRLRDKTIESTKKKIETLKSKLENLNS